MATVEKDNFERYGHYRKYAKKLADKPLGSRPIADDLGLTPADKQAAYREMRTAGFAGSIVDFVAWTAAMYFLELWLDSLGTKDWPPNKERWTASLMDMITRHSTEGKLAIRASRFITVNDVYSLSWMENGSEIELISAAVQKLNKLREDALNPTQEDDNHSILNRNGKIFITKTTAQNQSVTPGSTTSYITTQPQPTNQPTKRKKATLPAREK